MPRFNFFLRPAPRQSRIHLYAQSWNEERLLPFFFRHYDDFVERYVFYDDNSSDGTLEILSRHPRVEIRPFERTNSNSFVLSTQALQNAVWKESRGAADWVIVTVVDEHLYHPHLPAYLKWAKRKSITVIPGLGYEMVSFEFPACETSLSTAVRYGAVHGAVSKLSLFDPSAIEETNFAPGRHKAAPRGRVRYPKRDEVLNLHFKWLGADYVSSRYRLLRQGLGAVDRENKWGFQYDFSAAEIEKRLLELKATAVDVLDQRVKHHKSHTDRRWWRKRSTATWWDRWRLSGTR